MIKPPILARNVVEEVINTPTSSPAETPKLFIEEHQKQAKRIVHSATLRGSTTLIQLFEYLVGRSFEDAVNSLKEYTIGLEAFGRKTDFDPRPLACLMKTLNRITDADLG